MKILSTAGIAGAMAAVGSALINQYFALRIARQSRMYTEKKEAYNRFLEASEELSILLVSERDMPEGAPLEARAKAAGLLALAVARIKLVGSPGIIQVAVDFLATTSDPFGMRQLERTLLLNRFVDLARVELGVDTRPMPQGGIDGLVAEFNARQAVCVRPGERPGEADDPDAGRPDEGAAG